MTKVIAAGLLLVACGGVAGPLPLLLPCVSLSPSEQRALEAGDIVSKVVPADDGQVAIFAGTRIAADADTFVNATRSIADLKKSSFVLGIQRFSEPPQLADLNELVLTERDVSALAECALDACSFKLTRAEIATIVQARRQDGASRAVIEAALRRVLLERAKLYLSSGLGMLPPIENRGRAWRWDEALAALQAQSPCVTQFPPLAAWLEDYPHGASDVESFLYWSHEYYGAGKPVILLTHVAVFTPSAASAIVVGKQIFASRYMDGGIAVTALVRDDSGAHYLAYLNRTKVDLLGGVLGPLKRSILESRLENEVPQIIVKLRTRLERTNHDSRLNFVRYH